MDGQWDAAAIRKWKRPRPRKDLPQPKDLDADFIPLLREKCLDGRFSKAVKKEFYWDIFGYDLTELDSLHLVHSRLKEFTPEQLEEDADPQGLWALTQEPFTAYYLGKWTLPPALARKGKKLARKPRYWPNAEKAATKPGVAPRNDKLAEEADRGVRNPLLPDWNDLAGNHYYKKQLQPSFGIRIRQVINFLADEDAFRCDKWGEKIAELKEYLAWIRSSGVVPALQRDTVAQLELAERRLRSHEIFDRVHGTEDRVRLFRPNDLPKPQPRLRPVGDVLLSLGQEAAKPSLPRLVLHRAPQLVNRVHEYYRGKAAGFLEELAKAEDEVWMEEKLTRDGPPNLCKEENDTYEEHMKARKGWVVVDKVGGRSLPTGTALGQKANHFAAERGARRAGFQQCLNYFNSSENAQVQTPFRRLVLPTTPEEIDVAARATREIQFEPVALPPDYPKLQENQETHPYTVGFNKYRRERNGILEAARQRKEEAGEDDVAWVPLPKTYNVYKPRPFTLRTQHQQDLYKEMRVVSSLLSRARKIAPRPLLDEVQELVEEGAKDASERKSLADLRREGKVVFHSDLDDPNEKTGKVKLINDTELFWLKFLLTGSCNRGQVQDLPHENAELFLTFAERLQRLMDDISDDEKKLFKDVEEEVPLETLLEAMNRGVGDRTRRKTGFSPYDAIYWLKRLQNFGRCRFEEDYVSYGTVRRPKLDIHPEHLVWNQKLVPDGTQSWLGIPPDKRSEDEDTQVGAPRRNKDIVSLEFAIARGGPWAGDVEPAVRNFFLRLAYRFGYTLRHCRKVIWHQWWAQKVDQKRIDRAISRWETEFVKLAKEKGATLRLTEVVKKADPKAYEAHRAEKGDMTEQAAAALVREGVLHEAERSWTPLHPTPVEVRPGEVVLRRRSVWGWAQPEVRGEAPRFFSLDRWPLYLQSDKTAARVRTEVLDPRVLWDPCSEDITPTTWYRNKPEPFSDQDVIFREGPVSYVLGETPYQRKMLEAHITSRAAAALGMAVENPTWLQRLAGSLPFQHPAHDPPEPPSPVLPDIPVKQVPRSISWEYELARKRSAEDDEEAGPRKRPRLANARDYEGNDEAGDRDAMMSGAL